VRHLGPVFVFSNNNNMQYPSPSFQVFGALHDKLKLESAYYPENYAGVCCTEVVGRQWSKFISLYCLGSMLNHISVQGLCVTSVDEKSVSEPALYLNIVLAREECGDGDGGGGVTTPFVTLRYMPHETMTIDNLAEHIVVAPMLCDPALFRGDLFAKSPLRHAVFPAFFRDAKHAQTLHIGFSATSNTAASFAHSSVKDGFFQFTDFPHTCADARDALLSHINRPSFMAQVRALTTQPVHGPPRMRVLRVMPNGRLRARRCLSGGSVHVMVFLGVVPPSDAPAAGLAPPFSKVAFYHARHEMTIGSVDPMHNRGVLFCGDTDIYYGIPLHTGSLPMHILHMVWGEEDVEKPKPNNDDEECITLNMRSENIHYV